MRIKDKKLFEIREFLNSQDLSLTGTIQSHQTLEGAYGSDKEFEFIKEKGLSEPFREIESFIELRDCSGTITLDFCVNDEKSKVNVLGKLDLLLKTLNDIRLNIENYYGELAAYIRFSEEFAKLEKEKEKEGCQSG